MSRRAGAVLAALAVAFAATAASAARLVPGGYASDPLALVGDATPRAGEPAFVIEFTPRTAVGLLVEDGTRLRARAARLGMPEAPGLLPRDEDDAAGLVVGGALETGGLLLGGYYARAELFGAPADVLGARVRYGGLEAELGLVSQPEDVADPYRLLTVGAAFAATPWLAVESDLAVGQRGEDEPLAAGRIGIRLDF